MLKPREQSAIFIALRIRKLDPHDRLLEVQFFFFSRVSTIPSFSFADYLASLCVVLLQPINNGPTSPHCPTSPITAECFSNSLSTFHTQQVPPRARPSRTSKSPGYQLRSKWTTDVPTMVNVELRRQVINVYKGTTHNYDQHQQNYSKH